MQGRWLLLWIGLVHGVLAQPTGRWQAHTSMRQVTDLALAASAIWVATGGGVFRYHLAEGSLQRFTAVEGLHQVAVRALAWDARRQVLWIGYSDGVIDRLDPATGTVRAYFDIARAERFPDRQIYRLRMHGDSLLIATAFGVVVFDPVEGVVRDTYTQFGAFSDIAVYDLTVGPGPDGKPTLWLATAQGVAHAPRAHPNLKDPGAWTLERQGLDGKLPVRSIALHGQRLYIGLTQGLALRRQDGRYERLWEGAAVTDLQPVADLLLGAAGQQVLLVDAAASVRLLGSEGVRRPVRLAVQDDALWIGDAEAGLLRSTLPEADASGLELQEVIHPDGPYVNVFADLAVDPSGNLWATDAATGAQAGFHKMNAAGQWTAYLPDRLGGRKAFRPVHADPGGQVWVGSDGHGLVQVAPDGTLQFYDATNSTLEPAAGTRNFIIVRGLGADAEGRLWVANLTAPNPLHVRLPDGTWQRAPIPSCINSLSTTLGRLLVDDYGQLWIIAVSRGNLRVNTGLIIYDPGDDPTRADDDACRYLNERGSGGQGLPGVAVQALAEDRDGRIWIGTTEGLAYVLNNPFAASNPNTVPVWPLAAERQPGANPFLLTGLSVNDLAVDPANRLWVATDDGVYVIEQTGVDFRIAAHFNEENSPLLSDVVHAIAVDERSGRVFLATAAGLVSYQGDAIRPAEQARPLFVYPNPVRVGAEEDAIVFIEGLLEATELRIVTVDGRLVTRFPTRGGRVRWDGRDRYGRPVPSGVYLIIAVGQNGEGAAYGKVAILR